MSSVQIQPADSLNIITDMMDGCGILSGGILRQSGICYCV